MQLRTEIAKGAQLLQEKILKFQPKVVCFNGKGIYEIFSKEKKCKTGLQTTKIGTTQIFVMPSTSARSAHLPRWTDKLPFFQKLKEIVDTSRYDPSTSQQVKEHTSEQTDGRESRYFKKRKRDD
eukprot:m.100699 g.100699  ORF g.100699 m.100699 type:complete len:124 (-) comp22248_c0_seq1:26-397(-)